MQEIYKLVSEYDTIREHEKEIKKRKKYLADKIKAYAKENGVKDSQGSSYVETGDYIFGQQARKSVSLDEEKAKVMLEEKGLYEDVVEREVVEKINEDKLQEKLEEGKITMEELEEVTNIRVSYAIDIKKKENEDVSEMPEVQVSNSLKSKPLKEIKIKK